MYGAGLMLEQPMSIETPRRHPPNFTQWGSYIGHGGDTCARRRVLSNPRTGDPAAEAAHITVPQRLLPRPQLSLVHRRRVTRACPPRVGADGFLSEQGIVGNLGNASFSVVANTDGTYQIATTILACRVITAAAKVLTGQVIDLHCQL